MTNALSNTLDVHCHTWWSYDGFASFSDLHAWQRERGVLVLAVTDHDTLQGWWHEGELMSRAEFPWVIPGVELSCQLEGICFGLLGIGIDVNHLDLSEFLRRETKADKDELHGWITLIEASSNVEIGDVLQNWLDKTLFDFPERHRRYVPEWVRKRLLVEAGVATDAADAAEIHRAAITKLPIRNLPSSNEVLDLVHRAGGLAFLEHPSYDMEEPHVEVLCSQGLDGLEVYSSHLSEIERRKWLQFCYRHSLLPVAGSDHHGLRDGWGRLGQPCAHPPTLTERFIELIADNTHWGKSAPDICSAIRRAL